MPAEQSTAPPPGIVRRAAWAVTRLTWAATGALLPLYFAVMAVDAMLPVAAAWFTKHVIDALVGGGPVLVPAASLAVVGVLAAVLPAPTLLLGNVLGRRAALLATLRLFAATERLGGLARFEDPLFADRLRLAQQAPGSCGMLASSAFGLGRSGLTLIGFVGSLLAISPVLTVALLLAGLPVFLAQLRLSRRRAALHLRLGPTERREMFYANLLTTVQAAKEVRLFGIGGFLRGRLESQRRTADAEKTALDRREAAIEGGLSALGALVAAAALGWAVAAARSGRLGAGDVTVLLAAVAAVQTALYSLIGSLASAHQSLLLFDHYLAVERVEPDLPVVEPARPLPVLARGIRLRDVWFRYGDGHPWILRGVDLFLPHGSSTALVGANGAGKSTLVKLLCRFYDPTRGTIEWDGVDIRDVPVAELRARMSGVFQDYMTYDLTAAENVAVGDIDSCADRERIRRAARTAGVDATLAGLPDGYDTLLSRIFLPVGPRAGATMSGVLLSGGQWQRVALARAFMRRSPELVILDEPSSGLDVDAEHEVHEAMRQHRAGRSTLLISHRLNAVRDADVIVVLHDGVVAERGTHDELLDAEGRYARLFRRQAAGYRDDQVPMSAG
ncbi:multidrug ABC transporter permease [Virgisporangium aliadipatigenens]|uniref:Multidrug ABC transporter permease n=1 Tax=Virgisporangium aliadipatigenens TaxID=741659 RepID=A0A8J4DQU9_9ACTN|nr:ABC transporter ATP-binding protein [Virgisporangium aliadipatigenens]GIJ46108.1 multidrug ABC transporter permease [Virgisporangium aliadipatigenens]